MSTSEPDALGGFNDDYVFEHRYPYPLAVLYRRYRVSRTSTDRLGYIFAAAEASLKFLVAAALSGNNLQSATIGERETEEREMLAVLRKPSFGGWESLLRTLVKEPTDQTATPFDIALFRAVRGEKGGPSKYLSGIRALVEHRNTYAHAGAMTADRADPILEDATPIFREVFRQLAFLTKCTLILCDDVQRIRRPECFEAAVWLATGCNPAFPYDTWRLEDPIDPGVAYLLTPGAEYLRSLHPIVIFLTPEWSPYRKCYFYSGQNREYRWHTHESPDRNETRGSPELQEEMKDLIDGTLNPRASLVVFQNDVKPGWLTDHRAESTAELPLGYRMLGPIGIGRSGVVYRVVHSGLKEERALKVLRNDAAADPRMRRRFEIEAQILARLRGKDVAVDVFEYGEFASGIPFAVLEYAPEGTLEESMQRCGPRSWTDVLQIGFECFRSLATIHSIGVVHRDIKLSNLLYTSGGFRFCDFGIAQLPDTTHTRLTEVGDVIGTAAYMAPENLLGEADQRSDLFSLGVCLVNLLAGHPVPNPRAWLFSRYIGDDSFRKALLSVLEVVPANRPPSASAVVDRLAGIRAIWEKERESIPVAGAISDGALQAEPLGTIRQRRVWEAPDGTIFREIPSGQYMMGGTKYADERPVHRVELTGFFMASTPVTNRQFSTFVRETNFRDPHKNFLLQFRRGALPQGWSASDLPVTFVSWIAAKEYVLWRCETDNQDYRLPTEAQWEYACRAATRTVYPWGNRADKTLLNSNDLHRRPTAVGTYGANEFGIFDMLGNVWEWCEDVKDVTPREESLFYRKCSEAGHCVDPVNTTPGEIVSRRVEIGQRAIRGGSFFSEHRNCRPANRRGQVETDCVRSIGFRMIAVDPPIEALTDSLD